MAVVSRPAIRSLRRFLQGGTAAALIAAASLALPGAASAGGTGMMWQVPNEPTGRFTEAGQPGLCQCISHDNMRDFRCLPRAADCRAQCGNVYAFRPDADNSCAGH